MLPEGAVVTLSSSGQLIGDYCLLWLPDGDGLPGSPSPYIKAAMPSYLDVGS